MGHEFPRLEAHSQATYQRWSQAKPQLLKGHPVPTGREMEGGGTRENITNQLYLESRKH